VMDQPTNTIDYDVIVVGGRPAGSTLAARLGKFGYSVLLLERGTLPSLPAVSCPVIYASTMTLLDEIGAKESEYARDTPKIRRMVQAFSEELQTAIPLPDIDGRAYAYAVDRARFDAGLWDAALRFPTVTGWQNFAVTDLLWDGEGSQRKVVGIVGRGEDKVEKQIRARLVVGADGRFSLVARKVNAQVRDIDEEFPASIYYAYWKDLQAYDETGDATAVAYAGDGPYGFLVMNSAENTAAVAVEGRADFFADVQDAEAFYLDLCYRHPLLAKRLEGAERVTSVRGMKEVGNVYREAAGPGWALVGDAYHQKDPLDGQGIYNAVFSAKALAHAFRDWQRGEMTWREAVEWYDETVRIKTYSTFKALLSRVQMSFYAPQPPEWMMNSVTRWIMDDPAMQDLMGQFVTRKISADAMQLMSPMVVTRAVLRGGLRDLSEQVKSRLKLH
jgi:flavin-dependent dehydrogenase